MDHEVAAADALDQAEKIRRNLDSLSQEVTRDLDRLIQEVTQHLTPTSRDTNLVKALSHLITDTQLLRDHDEPLGPDDLGWIHPTRGIYLVPQRTRDALGAGYTTISLARALDRFGYLATSVETSGKRRYSTRARVGAGDTPYGNTPPRRVWHLTPQALRDLTNTRAQGERNGPLRVYAATTNGDTHALFTSREAAQAYTTAHRPTHPDITVETHRVYERADAPAPDDH